MIARETLIVEVFVKRRRVIRGTNGSSTFGGPLRAFRFRKPRSRHIRRSERGRSPTTGEEFLNDATG